MPTYDDHPFYSAKGQQIMLDIFNGIYQTDPNDATTIQDTDGKEMVKHFMKNKAGIVYNIRKYLSSYSPINADQSYDSGIYICDPSMGGCGRRDFMYNWEFVDFGVYGNMKTWRGNVDLISNKMNGQSGFLVMTRVRCNDYVVCKDCGEQWATQQSGAGVFAFIVILLMWKSVVVAKKVMPNISSRNKVYLCFVLKTNKWLNLKNM